jgi:PAB1-binding protein PBP1
MKTDTQINGSQEKSAKRELTKASDIMTFDKTLSREDDGKKFN